MKDLDQLRADNEALRQSHSELAKIVETLTGALASEIERNTERWAKLEERLESISDDLNDARGNLNGFLIEDLAEGEVEDDERRATREGLIARVCELETLVRGRNRSAPVKRNMTDEDAERCLRGDAKDMDHKDAGVYLGLTYAQVYSCRLEYTFKHVLKRLKEEGWKNPWVKK